MDDIVERLWSDYAQALRDDYPTNASKQELHFKNIVAAEIERLREEGAGLAAHQCLEPYGDEFGHASCRIKDERDRYKAVVDAAVAETEAEVTLVDPDTDVSVAIGLLENRREDRHAVVATYLASK